MVVRPVASMAVEPGRLEKLVAMKKRLSSIVAVSIALAGANVVAQNRPESSLIPSSLRLNWPPQAVNPVTTLDQLVREVLERNPELSALDRRIAAAQARVPQAGALPDPMFSTGIMNEGAPIPFQTLGKAGFSEVYIGVSQDFPYPGKRSLRERLAREDVEVERWSREAASRRVVAAVKEMYFELYALQTAADIITRNQQTLEQLERTAAVRLAVGQTSQQDVLDAEVERSRLDERLALLYRRALASQARIRSLLRLAPDWTIGRLAPIERSRDLPPLTVLQQAAVEQAPELHRAEREVARAKVALDLARRELKPDFGANVTYHNRGGLDPYWAVGGTLKFPLYARRKQQKAVEEADATAGASRDELEARRLDVAFQVEDAYAAATTSARLLTLYDEGILRQARLAVESARINYEVGKIDFLTTLTSWIRLRDYEITYYEQLVQYQQALVRLEAVTGLPLTQ